MVVEGAFEVNGWMRRMACLPMILLAAVAAAVVVEEPTFAAQSEANSETLVDIPDVALRRAVETALGKSDGDPVSRGEMATLASLGGSGVRELTGLEYAVNMHLLNLWSGRISSLEPLSGLTSLRHLHLVDDAIADLSALAGLTSLTSLNLQVNDISDVSPLSGMTSLTTLNLSGNEIADVSPLSGMTSLTNLNMGHNNIYDLSPLSDLTSLTTLNLVGKNEIVDLEPLAHLTSLEGLHLYGNRISDVSPLVANEGLGSGDVVDLRRNPLGRASLETHVPALRERGVEVEFDPPLELPELLDAELREAVYRALSRIPTSKNRAFATMVVLDASSRGIEDLTGLEGAAGLRGLFLDRNRITNIAPLSELESLRMLTLTHNTVEDLTALAGSGSLVYLALDGNSLRDLPSLPPQVRFLYLSDNSLSNIDSLANLWLVELDVSRNSISSLAPLGGHDGLRYLHVHDNRIGDLSPLNFQSLREIHLRNNRVRDLSPLLAGEALLMVDARRNPLEDGALAVLDALRERRVTVLAGETVPYFPAAGGAREGFVRVVNRGDEDGHAFIEAVDDAGVRAARVRLDVGARRAVHFNSEDLERGNAAKGLSGGIGPPTAGDWRLSVISALDLEVLSYARTRDGFVTAMHDVAPDATAPIFNPGGNRRQRSILRVVNTEAEPAKWTTGGYDDAGRWRPMAGSLLARPQHALTLTAQALEEEHGLGDGQGKWRLRVRGFPWYAMSLLESPTGHLTNLSTAPDNGTPLADGGTLYRLPLFPAAGGARQGFARVINRSYEAGAASIKAVDDAGERFGPMELALGPRRTMHFNSSELEEGSAAKGWNGVGDGDGDWRLEVSSNLDLTVLGYARTADGFVTSLHDLAPAAEDGARRVPFFNPGSNAGQVSSLRLINDGERSARATVTGVDDGGDGSGTVTLTVPAGAALSFTSAELEAGGDGFAGSLGDGVGKWRLRVRSDEPIAVMSLLETPTGHLTNVSTGTAD